MSVETRFKAFVARVEKEQLSFESIAIADAEHVLFEHHFTPDLPRNIYSHTKSYTSVGAGIAIDSRLLSLDDFLAAMFPESLPENPDPRLFTITLRHLLTMSSGFNTAYLMNSDRRSGTGAPDYMRYMLSRPVKAQPGSRFAYSSADSILIVRMVEKATGQPFGAFMYENVFSKMDLGWPLWEYDPQGHPNGGGGLFLRLTDMLRIGQVCLTGGEYHGRRIVSGEWLKQATSLQIDFPHGGLWSCGYGYQFWLSPYPGAYRADGAYGQITTVLPESGLVVAVQCPETGDFDKTRPVLHELLAQL